MKIRRGDIVEAIKGKDAGKKGKVLQVFIAAKKAIVEGINQVKKHKRKTQKDQQGGIISIEVPISIANLMLVCKHCNAKTKIGFMKLKDGSKSRFCKSCKETI